MRSGRRIPTGGLPNCFQSLQPLFGEVCHFCQILPSVPAAKISCRLSWFLPTVNWSVNDTSGATVPSVSQSLQPLFGCTCHLCQRALSSARANISSRPSAFLPTTCALICTVDEGLSLL